MHLFTGAKRICLAKSREAAPLNAHRSIQMHLAVWPAGPNCASRECVSLQQIKVPKYTRTRVKCAR